MMKYRPPIFILFAMILAFSLVHGRQAQGFPLTAAMLPNLGSETKAPEPKPEKDSLHRETPRGSFTGFVKAAQKGDYLKASQYLIAQPGKSQEQIKELIIQFQVLLDRGFLGSLEAISDEPMGNLADGLKPNEDSIGKIQIKDQSLDIIMVKIKTQSGRELWFISNETLKGVPALYKKLELSALASKLPKFLVEKTFLNAPLYMWIGAILFLPLFWGGSWLLVHAFIYLVRLIKKLFRRPLEPYPYKPARPVIVLLTLFFHYLAVSIMGLPYLLRVYYARLITVGIWLGVGWLAFQFIDGMARRYLKHLMKQGALNAHSIMMLVRKILQVVVLVVIVLVIFKILGFKVDVALAGLGIGGVALALAAQKTIENLFGGLSLLSDQAIRVGEFCKIGDRVGTVEDISLRSTRLRTLDRTLLYVPNGSLSVDNLENYSRRDKFWFHHVMSLRYETTSGQIQKIITDIKKLFEAHDQVENATSWVKFVRMGAFSLDVELFAYLLVKEYVEHLKCSEELLLKCMEIVEVAGTGFAFPSQTTYLTQDTFTSPSK